ncbi:MAG: Short-chain type dehydrogenase/reductase [Sphaerisporangium sp.]|nr:Short-chain type dehydrogenase/reductase [Sphaerisporangium sp.]
MSTTVKVIIGIGGMGRAIARRLGSGSTLVLADYSTEVLALAARDLRDEGHQVVTQKVDISDTASVVALARAAADVGPVTTVVHTAGLSPVQAAPGAILAVDLLGTATVLDAFGEVIVAGGAGVFIASIAGHLASLPTEVEHALSTTPTAELLALPFLSAKSIATSSAAYGLAKRANQLRVAAAAHSWGRRGARVNSISPGIIATSMGQAELAGSAGEAMRAMISASAAGRLGTAEDIAAAADFLTGPHATFITGTDVLVDGGVVAAHRNGRVNVGQG